MSRVRFGVVGCGRMQANHQRGYALLAERLTISAVADLDLARAEAVASAIGADRAVRSYHELLDDVDAVLVAVPNHLHHEIGVACLEAGKHVLMEKPLANTEEDCLDLIDVAQRAGRVLMTAYPLRYHPVVSRLQELLDAQAYGEVFDVSLVTEQYHRYPDDHWRASLAKRGGGLFFTHGCHYVDLMLAFLGRPLGGTHVGVSRGTPWAPGEGTSSASIRFVNGSLGTYFGTAGARGAQRRGAIIQAFCTEGTLEADVASGHLHLHSAHGSKPLLRGEGGQKYTHKELEHFLDRIEDGDRPLTDGRRSLQGLRVIWRLYEAEREGVVADLRGLGLDERAFVTGPSGQATDGLPITMARATEEESRW